MTDEIKKLFAVYRQAIEAARIIRNLIEEGNQGAAAIGLLRMEEIISTIELRKEG